MSVELSIEEATHRLRAITLKRTARRSRIHQNAGWEAELRISALNGICGQCTNLIVKPVHAGGHESVKLICKENHSPVALYEATPLGETPDCPDLTKK